MMRMRWMIGLVAAAGIGACAPAIPYDSPGGTLGGDSAYQREKSARDAALAGDGWARAGGGAGAPLDATGGAVTARTDTGASEAELIAADARAALDAAGSGDGPGLAGPSTPSPSALGTGGISQENDFDAVGAERSIEEDAARIARNRAQYEMVRPEAIGERPTDLGPNIVDYALATTHPVGTEMYGRINFAAAARHERNCAGYPSPDQAQLDFLRKGGPERDRMALDPDGDGYACGWDPAPYRRARGD